MCAERTTGLLNFLLRRAWLGGGGLGDWFVFIPVLQQSCLWHNQDCDKRSINPTSRWVVYLLEWSFVPTIGSIDQQVTFSSSNLFSVNAGLLQRCPLPLILLLIMWPEFLRAAMGPERLWFGDHRISTLSLCFWEEGPWAKRQTFAFTDQSMVPPSPVVRNFGSWPDCGHGSRKQATEINFLCMVTGTCLCNRVRYPAISWVTLRMTPKPLFLWPHPEQGQRIPVNCSQTLNVPQTLLQNCSLNVLWTYLQHFYPHSILLYQVLPKLYLNYILNSATVVMRCKVYWWQNKCVHTNLLHKCNL